MANLDNSSEKAEHKNNFDCLIISPKQARQVANLLHREGCDLMSDEDDVKSEFKLLSLENPSLSAPEIIKRMIVLARQSRGHHPVAVVRIDDDQDDDRPALVIEANTEELLPLSRTSEVIELDIDNLRQKVMIERNCGDRMARIAINDIALKLGEKDFFTELTVKAICAGQWINGGRRSGRASQKVQPDGQTQAGLFDLEGGSA